MRLPHGGALVDRTARLGLTFNGRPLSALRGDTLASALLANGVRVVGRSFKYHRPRGIVALGHDEPNALVQLEPDSPFSEPNSRATCVAVYDGLRAVSQNCWPSVDLDVGALAWRLHRFMPAGFYYKTFKWPRWEAFEPFIRRAAGLGRAPTERDPARHLKRHAHCDVLVVGGGPAGLAAALAAAERGERVVLAHAGRHFGGAATGRPDARLDDIAATQWIDEATARLRACPDALLLSDCVVLGRYDHGMAVAVERLDAMSPAEAGARPRQRVWHIRARRTVLATGAHERPLVFPDNDRPGVMLSSAVAGYAHRYGVAAGRRVVVVTNDDQAYATAASLLAAGVGVAAILDLRARTDAPTGAGALLEHGVEVASAVRVRAVRGARGVSAIGFSTAGRDRWIECDALALSGGWTPAVQLFAQSGGALRYDPSAKAFLPTRDGDEVTCVGAAAGCFDPQSALDQARDETGHGRTRGAGSHSAAAGSDWFNSAEPADRQWVDFQSDVTAADVLLAAHEGFVSVEHLKRYTTIGMATDQGKSSNVNALAILGEATNRLPMQVGTTRFRPPYVPVTLSAIAAGRSGDAYAPRRDLPGDSAHRARGAVFQDFGGWQRPDHYPRAGESRDQAVRREQRLVRATAGLFDASPIGKIEVRGRDAERFLDFIYANRIEGLATGRIRYGLMLNEHGTVFDDGVCARLSDRTYLVSPSSGAATRVAAWLDEWRQCEFAAWDVNVLDVTGSWASIAIAGPASRRILEALDTEIDLSREATPHMSVRQGRLEGMACRLMRVSYSGEMQFEIQVPADQSEWLWNRLLEVGSEHGIGPVGVEAWLRLRIEKGYVHVGTDTDGNTQPADIGFGPAIDRKAGDFVGRRSLLRRDAMRSDRDQLVGLKVVEARESSALPVGAVLLAAGTKPGNGASSEGRVTSSCYSPSLGMPVALALVRGGRARYGTRLDAWFDGRSMTAEIVEPVFYDRAGACLNG